ncbi:MAG: proline--tRNA ligase [Patescibacteria group bacterium]
MKRSFFLAKTRTEDPANETARNAKLLIRAGFIHKEMAGVYAYLPLGLRVLKKIENIIRQEMNTIGGQELMMTTLQDASLWEKSGRWDDEVLDIWFKTKLANGQTLGIANTHEEPITNLLTHQLFSYKDLPVYVYQFQNKFRNELRAKSGIMRTREFLMKDLYSFNKTEDDFKEFYEKCAEAYNRIYQKVGIRDITYRTVAAGGSFTSGFTDEFQTISSAGEDIIYIDKNKKLAVNEEVYNEDTLKQYGLQKADLVKEKAVEVGNIFPLGTKYAEAMGLLLTDEAGQSKPPIMGSYGIGLGRLLGTLAEVLSDDQGLVWPVSVAPFQVYLVGLNLDQAPVKEFAEEVYMEITKAGLEVIYDDRQEAGAGDKLSDADLLGIPFRVVVSAKTLAENKVEFKKRTESENKLMDVKEVINYVIENIK